MRLIWVLLTVALLPTMAAAQSRAETLADIRAQLAQLSSEVTGLRAELSTTGAAQPGVATGSTLQRMDTIEAALSQLTAKTEALEFRINRIVTDGTNRIGDLEFRVTELEGGDLGAIGQTPVLGGEAPPAAALAPVATDAPELAVSEQADFDRARAVLDQGDFRTAADLFAAFTETYTGGPLSGEANFLRGEALASLGETSNAARAYLESFSGDPGGPRAPEALLRLGLSLNQLGQTPEACVTLREVGTRFPGSGPAIEAGNVLAGLSCP